jgi:hypothetical protein
MNDPNRRSDDVFKVPIVGHRRKQLIPNAVFGPSGKADEHTVPIAKASRQIAPREPLPRYEGNADSNTSFGL